MKKELKRFFGLDEGRRLMVSVRGLLTAVLFVCRYTPARIGEDTVLS